MSFVSACVLGALTALALDADNDGMQDDYESFFSLDPSNAADAQLNYDTDALTNLEESVLWTDPYVGDTDNDGWNDDTDSNPLSRAVIEWGHPDFTDGDNYSYTGPAWWLSAVRDGGAWTNTGWHVPASESAGVGALLVGVDRGVVTSPIAYEVTFLDHAGSQLYVDLQDTNGVVSASNLVGNLVGGTDLEVVQNLTIPLDTYPSAAIIKLRRGVGEVTVYRSVLYIDQDGDGLDLDQELQLGTSDSNPDTTSPQIYCQGASADAQVLSNAGFEAGAGSGSQSINDWYLFGNVYHEAVNPRTGVMHAKLFGNFTSSVNYSGIYQDHAALPGELWRGVVRVMTSSSDALSGNNHVIVKLEYFNSSYQFLGASESDALDSSMLHDAYMPLVVTGNTPTGAAIIRLAVLFIQESDNAGGSVYIDDARLEKIETDLTVSCTTDIPASDSSVIVATDNTDPDPLITFAGDVSNGSGCGGDPLIVTRTWRATDEAGNAADCSVLYRYEDDEAPVITVEQPDVNVLLNADFEGGASSGTTVPTNWIGFGRCYQEEAMPRTGQRHVKLFSNFTGAENLSGLFQDAPAFDGDVWRLTAYALSAYEDVIRGDNIAFIKIEFFDGSYSWVSQTESVRLDAAMPVDEYVPLSVSAVTPTNAAYIRAALLFEGDAANSAGSIYFDDVVLERISMQPPPPDYSSVTAVDDCDGSVIISYVGDTTNSGSGCSGDPAIVTRTWRATDACGNYSEATQVYTYEDNRAPLVMLPPDIAIDPAASTDPTNTGFAIMVGDVNETATLTYSDQFHSVPLPESSYIDRTWTAVDGCGNVADATQRITLTLDVDGDGIPNSWEVQYGLDPENPADAQDDLDHDGLTNIEEYMAGTNPFVWDTDGDGVSDGMEVHDTGTNPADADFTDIITVVAVNGADATETLGEWETNGPAIYANGPRGSLTYSIETSESDVYRLEIEGCARYPFGISNVYDLVVYVDDEYIGRQTLHTTGTSSAVVQVVTPWLAQGTHTIRVFWDNAASWRSLQVNALRLQSLLGPDADANGRKDWVDQRLARQCTVDVVSGLSFVSPVCVEGIGSYPGMMSISAGTLHQGVSNRWYADLPLSITAVTSAIMSFQNGAAILTNQFSWVPMNVIGADDTEIRLDDSLLLTATPVGVATGRVTITIAGVTSYVTTVVAPVAHTFSSTGVFTVVGTYGQGASMLTDSITVSVVSASFGGSPAVWVNKPRTWNCPAIGEDVVVQGDQDIILHNQGSLPEGGRVYQLSSSVVGKTQRIIARLGNDGPVLAQTTVQGFNVRSSSETYLHRIDEYADGSVVFETGIVGPFPQQVTLRLEIIVGGLIFDDGSMVKELTSADLDELDSVSVRFIRDGGSDTSICHFLKAYEDGRLIGMR